MKLLRAVWLLFLITACGHGPAASPEDIQADSDVRERIGHYYRDFNSYDWEALAEHFWNGAEITTVWQAPGEDADRVVHTTIDEFFADAPRDYPPDEDFEAWIIGADVQVYRDLAQAWVRFGAKLDSNGDLTEWDGVDAFTFLKHGEVWKIAALLFTSDGQ